MLFCRAEALASRSVPVESVVVPVNVLAPPRTSVPAPAFLRPKALPESPITPPIVRAFTPLTVTVRTSPSGRLPIVTAPVLKLSVFVPPKAKSPFHDWALVIVRAVFTSSVPALIASGPVPRAVALPSVSAPELRNVVPE